MEEVEGKKRRNSAHTDAPTAHTDILTHAHTRTHTHSHTHTQTDNQLLKARVLPPLNIQREILRSTLNIISRPLINRQFIEVSDLYFMKFSCDW